MRLFFCIQNHIKIKPFSLHLLNDSLKNKKNTLLNIRSCREWKKHDFPLTSNLSVSVYQPPWLDLYHKFRIHVKIPSRH